MAIENNVQPAEAAPPESNVPVVRVKVGSIPITEIDIGGRVGGAVRKVDQEHVKALAESIAETGLLHPITVYHKNAGYGLNIGLHRLRAYEALSRKEIPAILTDKSKPERGLAECDENLCGAKLTPTERAHFMAARKRLYESLHPETKKGTAQGQGKKRSAAKAEAVSHSQVGGEIVAEDPPKHPSFVEDTAAKTGLSETTIARDAERGSKVADDVKAAIAGTALDSGTVLDELKGLPPEEQREHVKARQAAPPKARQPSKKKVAAGGPPLQRLPLGSRPQPGSFAAAQADAQLDEAVASFKAAWKKASPAERLKHKPAVADIIIPDDDPSLFKSATKERKEPTAEAFIDKFIAGLRTVLNNRKEMIDRLIKVRQDIAPEKRRELVGELYHTALLLKKYASQIENRTPEEMNGAADESGVKSKAMNAILPSERRQLPAPDGKPA